MLHLIGKALLFAGYMAFLVVILASLKTIVMSYTNFSSWITPTICYFLNRLEADTLIGSSIAFSSANWLKSKVTNYWTN